MKLSRCSYARFWASLSALYGGLCIGAEFAGSPLSGVKGFAVLFLQWLVVTVAASAIIGLISVSRRIFAVLFPLLSVSSAIAVFYKLTLGTALTANVIDLAIVNNAATWMTLISWQVILVVVATLGISIVIAWYRYRYVNRPEHAYWSCVAFILMAVTPTCILTRFRDPVVARVPYVFWYATSDYLANRSSIAEERSTFGNTPVTSGSDSVTVVVVVGESLRADHLGLNGYGRNTTPHLGSDSTVVSLPNIFTEHYYTHTSVPHILTRADSLHPLRAYDEQSFITLLKQGGFRTAWLSNQDQVRTYAYFMHEADTLIQCNAHRNLYSYDKWLDTDMVPYFTQILEDNGPRQLVVVHAIGSHWWYRSHYPDSLALFTPEIDSRVVSELSREQMVNSYDNTILATDDFLSRLTDELSNRPAILIYISDHGEALGENGNYLHAEDFPELHNPACIVWYSPTYAMKFPEKISALNRNADKRMSTDIIFHSVLDAADVHTTVADSTLSIFR